MCCSSRYFRANCLADWIASDACAIVFQLCQFRITCMRMLRTNQSKITRPGVVDKSPKPRCSSQCVAQCFFQLALWKKDIFFVVNIVVKNKLKCGLSWSVLLSTTSTRHCSFPKHIFVLFLHVESEFAKVFEREVWRVQVAYLHNAARALWSLSRCFQYQFIFDIVAKNKSNVVWCGTGEIPLI